MTISSLVRPLPGYPPDVAWVYLAPTRDRPNGRVHALDSRDGRTAWCALPLRDPAPWPSGVPSPPPVCGLCHKAVEAWTRRRAGAARKEQAG